LIKIQLNGETKETEHTALVTFLKQHWQGPTCFAIVINQQFIARAHYAKTQLKQGDCIDVILPMQGG